RGAADCPRAVRDMRALLSLRSQALLLGAANHRLNPDGSLEGLVDMLKGRIDSEPSRLGAPAPDRCALMQGPAGPRGGAFLDHENVPPVIDEGPIDVGAVGGGVAGESTAADRHHPPDVGDAAAARGVAEHVAAADRQRPAVVDAAAKVGGAASD